jgi:hypothetical protein
VGMIAAGVPGDEASDDGLARGEHCFGIEPALQESEGEGASANRAAPGLILPRESGRGYAAMRSMSAGER